MKGVISEPWCNLAIGGLFCCTCEPGDLPRLPWLVVKI